MTILDVIPLDPRIVSKLARVARHHNVFPQYLSFHAGPTGTHPISDLYQSLLLQCREYLDVMSDTEIAAAAASLPQWCLHYDLTPPYVPRGPILERLAHSIVQWAVSIDYIDFAAAVRNSPDEGVVLDQIPELKACFDEDGLLVIDARFQLHDGAIFYKDHVLHYHQLLRRGYMSNPNFDFLGAFAAYQRREPKNVFRIAIDHSRLMERKWYQNLVELDTWQGPPFDASTLDDPGSVGLTVIGRNQKSLFAMINSLLYTDFFWSCRDGIKTLQIEEVSNAQYIFGPYNLNRYVHTEREIGQGILRHFDGAVKVYRREDYAARVNAHLPSVTRSFTKPKLFRIDGNIDVQTWIDLTCLFMKGNEMVVEYFNPEEFRRLFELRIRDPDEWERLAQSKT